MIISRTPFRISLAGGGTDLPSYYRRRPGAVLSTAIDKYMYITVNRFFLEDQIILKYSKNELVDSVNAIRHPLLRESLRLAGVGRGIEITSMADVIGGTGLGSSSSFTVGVLNALHAYKGEYATREQLAREACTVELDKVKEPIGKQDQYIAAYGGFQFIEFMPDETVRVDPVICPPGTLKDLQARLLLLFTGVTRQAKPILRRVQAAGKRNEGRLDALADLARTARAELQAGRVGAIGDVLHQGWEYKRELAGGVTNASIDAAYDKARRAGARGGKILGAGGGGFLLLYVEPNRRAAVRKSLSKWREIPFTFEPQGSKILHVGD